MLEKCRFEIKVGYATQVEINAYGTVEAREARLAAVSFLKKLGEMYGCGGLAYLTALCYEAIQGKLVEEKASTVGKEVLLAGVHEGGSSFLMAFSGRELFEKFDATNWMGSSQIAGIRRLEGRIHPLPREVAVGDTFTFGRDPFELNSWGITFQLLDQQGNVRSEGAYTLPEEKAAPSDIEVG